jgi:predicted nucleic acid-binding protein
MRIYLDNCSFNRPFDEQDQFKIRLETEAKQFIQMQIISGTYELVWSYVLEMENNQNPFEDKRNAILDWKEIAKVHCEENELILLKAKELRNSGLKVMDSLHISCAIYSKCDFFITTDKQLCNKENSEIRIVNPVTFVDEMED